MALRQASSLQTLVLLSAGLMLKLIFYHLLGFFALPLASAYDLLHSCL